MMIKLHQISHAVLAVVLGTGTLAFGQAAVPDAGAYRPTAYPETYQSVFYPGTELRALPPARAAAVAAKAELNRAESNLTVTVSELRRRASRSPELLQAMAEEKIAWELYRDARELALAELKKDPNYQAGIELKQRLADQLEQARKNPDAKRERVVALATVKLSYSGATTEMESSILAADEKAQAARKRLIEAGNRVSALRQQMDDAVRDNPDVLLARKSLADAKTAALASDALYIEARNVAKVAIDYAYDLLYRPPQSYAINDPYYGYGYSGYPVVGYPYNWRHR